MADIYEILEKLGIEYAKYEHPAVFTVAEAGKYERGIAGGKTKNLFLQSEKEGKYYLVIVEGARRVDLKKLAASLGVKRLSFASAEKLFEKLGLTPGSVSPFGLINDGERVVKVVVDKNLLRYEKLGFHPNINTATLVIATQDLTKFLEWTGNRTEYLDQLN